MTSLHDLVSDFFFHCKHEKLLSKATLKAYEIDVAQFNLFLRSKSVYKLNEINKECLRSYILLIQGRYKVKTVKRKIACLKALFSYYEDINDSAISPFRKLRLKIREPFRVPTVLNLNEIKSIFSHLYTTKNSIPDKKSFVYKTHVRDIAVIELLFATGLRVSELSNLKCNNISLSEGVIKILGKGNKERVIQLCNKNVIDVLSEYFDLFQESIYVSQYFFINRRNNRLSEQSIRNTVKNLVNQTAIAKRVTPHTYRHTFATTLLEEGVDIKYIQALLGHSSILTTQIYTHVNNVKQKEILSLMHPRNKFSFG